MKSVTGRWLCMWPDGSRSVVFDAYTVEDAIEVLDETDAAEPYMLHPIPDGPAFIHFRKVKESGQTYFVPYGESEVLGYEVGRRRRRRKPEEVQPISEKARCIARDMGMSVTLANNMALESDPEFKAGAVQ